MKLIQPIANCAFLIDDNGNAHCFSYQSEVAAIINGKYIPYDGEKFYSRTNNKHKSMFKAHFGL